jgi:2'-5' RNA ligase
MPDREENPVHIVIGLEPAIEVVERLTLAQQELESPCRQLGLDMNWVDPAHFRLILRSIEIPSLDWSATLREHLQVILRGRRALEWRTGGLEWLPSEQEPALLATQVIGDGAQEILSLQRQLDACATRLGAPATRQPWAPYIRVARGHTSSGSVDMRGVLTRVGALDWGITRSTALVLWTTERHHERSRTRVNCRLPLSA